MTTPTPGKFTVPPVCKMTRKAEDAWWEKVAAERGCTLAQWDNPRDAAHVSPKPAPKILRRA